MRGLCLRPDLPIKGSIAVPGCALTYVQDGEESMFMASQRTVKVNESVLINYVS